MQRTVNPGYPGCPYALGKTWANPLHVTFFYLFSFLMCFATYSTAATESPTARQRTKKKGLHWPWYESLLYQQRHRIDGCCRFSNESAVWSIVDTTRTILDGTEEEAQTSSSNLSVQNDSQCEWLQQIQNVRAYRYRTVGTPVNYC